MRSLPPQGEPGRPRRVPTRIPYLIARKKVREASWACTIGRRIRRRRQLLPFELSAFLGIPELRPSTQSTVFMDLRSILASAERERPQTIQLACPFMNNLHPADNHESPARRLEVLYVVSLIAVALLSAVGQTFIIRELTRQSETLSAIGQAARQHSIDGSLSLAALAVQASQELQTVANAWMCSGMRPGGRSPTRSATDKSPPREVADPAGDAGEGGVPRRRCTARRRSGWRKSCSTGPAGRARSQSERMTRCW